MKNVYLFQPQYSVEVRNQDSYWIPYSVGCLWSYCNQFEHIKNNFEIKDIIFKREHPDQILNKLQDPCLCTFSCYVWNEQYCLYIAKLIKQKFPNCIIQFGGPQTSIKTIKNNDFIDCVIIGEGELSYLELLNTVLSDKPMQKIYQKNRIEDLNFPSPYQTGIFNKIIEKNPSVLWATTLETNRGCPHSCTFCDWGSLTYSKVKLFDLNRVNSDLDWISKNNVAFLFCADANFGMYKERDIEIAKMIREIANNSILESVSIQYAKNSTEVVFEIAQILGDISRGVTLSVQSMNEPTLKAIKRKNLHINNLKSHIKRSKQLKVKTYTELILGLPDETLDSWKEGFSKILECGQHESIDVWFCLVFENSELNSNFSRELYKIKTINAEDYLSFTNQKDFSDIKETVELINQTNTMSTEELIECYMYGWLIVQFHIAGYTQILSKYYFNVLNLSYREFYDNLFDIIKKDTGILGSHYKKINEIISTYVKTGKIIENAKTGGHSLHVISFEFMFKNKNIIFDLLGEKLNPSLEIFELQKSFIFNENEIYPKILESNYDIENWENKKIVYKINNNFKDYDGTNFFILRRKGLLQNTISKIRE
jgi:radical SAM superfamily enzyme YgiQ (UPF0313 family)